MEDVSLKGDEESVPITVGKGAEAEEKEQQEKQLDEEVVVSVGTDSDAVVVEETKVDEKSQAPSDEVDEAAVDSSKLAEIESKNEKETDAAVVEENQIDLRDIEECDTGGNEIPDVSEETASSQAADTVETPPNQAAEETPAGEAQIKLEALEAACELSVQSTNSQQQPDVVAIDDDDDEDEDGINDEDDDEDGDDEDDDDDDEGVSNATLNDDEDRQSELYKAKAKTTSAAIHLPHPLDDFDDDYDELDDDDGTGDDLKDDSNAAVVIGSSDEEDQVPQKLHKTVEKYEDVDDELDYDDDDLDEDDDEYDDDDLMNAVVTSATKVLPSESSSPFKKIHRQDSMRSAREREADQISVLKRGINYGRIAKKKSLNWLYNRKKREAYKLILPRNRRQSTTSAAMRSDQSGGLLHLKISPPSVTSIAQKHIIKQPPSTPIISRTESRVSVSVTPQKREPSEEYVIDLDSSPEKSNQEQSTPRRQSDGQQDSATDVKKPPDNKEEEQQNSTMQQTDKVRDSIQKSTEEVQEDKSVSRLNSEQNKENLQSNEALKKERDEVSSKQEIESKDAHASEEIMDTTEEISERTFKAEALTTSTAASLKTDLKEEKNDKLSTPPPTVDVSAASKVVIEDVPENETTTRPASAQQSTGIATSKRRRSSSGTHESNKVSKTNAGISTGVEQDDDEEYIHPTKKLREELQSNYPAHDRILNEYIEKTSNDSIDSIQRHIEQMLSEIQTLNDMIKAKEIEWNNMLHLKKVKEEICFRLSRRKQCMEIMATKVGEAINPSPLEEEFLNNESTLALGKTPPSQKNPQLASTPIAGAINSISSNICNFTAVSSSSSAAPTTAQLIIQNRANMKSSDLVKEKANTQRLHRLLVSRNILPKPTASPTGANVTQPSNSTNGPCASSSSTQPILNSYLTSADSVHQLFDMMNGHHSNHGGLQNGSSTGNNNSQAAMVGRQGPFKDVRSIIADFRQQHPEVVPRRGRRNSRPSSNDSSSHSLSNPNPPATNNNTVNSFKDVLAPFAKSQGAASLRSTGGQQQNPPYPEVTLHPVTAPVASSGGDQPTGSLLHGYLTKFPRPNDSAANTKSAGNQTSANYISNFSPTLARLLTAPERISATAGASGHHSSNSGGADGCGNSVNAHHSISGFGVNLSKVVGHNSEITITPVINSMHQQSILQQQLQQQQLKEVLNRAANANNVKDEHFLKLSSFASAPAGNDDDAEDSVDRLVIDEGVDAMAGADEHQRIAPHAIGQEFNENEVPVCQGCKKHEAQFVCAGCGNQWYCSRECQVTAWDDHSEVCTATKQIRNNFNVLKSRDLVRGDQFYIVRRRKRNKFYPQY